MELRRASVVLVILAFAPGTFGSAAVQGVEFELFASDGEADDHLGFAVGAAGDVLVAGAAGDDDGGADAGAAYVYRFDGAGWSEEQKLRASDADADDQFGVAVAAAGDTVLVGAWEDDHLGASAGSAYVYRFDGSSWLEEQKLLASDGTAGDRFGVSAALAGDVALLGTWGDADSGPNSGSAYVYRFDGSSWVQEQKLLASDGVAFDHFGFSVALSGDVALVGAYGDDDNGGYAGSAYVYRFDGSGWVEEQKLLPANGAANEFFGYSVALSGEWALVGALGDAGQGISAGAVYAYRFDGSSWIEEQRVVASDGAALDSFGRAVAVDGETALVGAPGDADQGASTGSAYVFGFDGSSWLEEAKLLASQGGSAELLGEAVALLGRIAIAGAPGDGTGGGAAGAVSVFDPGTCGDSVLDPGEACDDGARDPGDGCSATCQVEGCSNGVDDDGDGFVDHAGGDPGCWGPADLSERSGFLACDNGLDDDGDGQADAPADPGCRDAASPVEDPQCQDGLDNDGQFGTDFDGGASVLGAGNADPDGADPDCTAAWIGRERRACGLGYELAPLLLVWAAARRRSALGVTSERG